MQIKNGKSITTIILTSLLALSICSPEIVLAEASSVRVGLPGRRVGGGTRGECSFGEKQLTALIPKNNLALTVAAEPQLFFYIPPATDAQTLEFVLIDEADNQVYEKTFKPSVTNGIISLNIVDSTSKGLKVGKKYHWYLSVICNIQDRSNDISVDGWIQRVEPQSSFSKKLEQAAPLQRLVMYEAANLWQDVLTTLAHLRSSYPNDVNVTKQWTKLLRSVELNNIAQEPLKIGIEIKNPKSKIQNLKLLKPIS